MNRMSERELPNLRGMEDRLIANVASHFIDETFCLPFPHTTPIVVSGILGVSESLGHEPGSKDLQNKQGTDGGVPIGSPMLKLDREIGSVNVSFQ